MYKQRSLHAFCRKNVTTELIVNQTGKSGRITIATRDNKQTGKVETLFLYVVNAFQACMNVKYENKKFPQHAST